MPSTQPVASSSKHKKSSKHSKSKTNGESSSSSKHDASPFEFRRAYMRLSIPPVFAGDFKRGAAEMLESLVMRYVPQLEAEIINDCPFGVCAVEFDAVLWAPRIGQRLSGTHSLSSPSHLSLLFAKTFNISISLQHIPDDHYEFDYGAGDAQSIDDSDDESDDDEEEEGGHVHEVGRWRNKKTGKLVGQDEGDRLKFTVIGLHVSNQMLSLTGSLLKDPSKPKRLPTPAVQIARGSESVSPEPEQQQEQEPEVSTAIETMQGAIPAVDAAVEAAERKKRRDEKKAKKREKEAAKLAKLQAAGAAQMVEIEPEIKEETAYTPKPEKKRKAGEDGEGSKTAKKRKSVA